MAYDSECWNLAEYFLTDENLGEKRKEATDALAQQIQTVIEDFCKFDLPKYTGVATEGSEKIIKTIGSEGEVSSGGGEDI
jgi:hypothetical protein